MSSYIVRFGAMRFLGVFAPSGDCAYRPHTKVLVRTDRGLEVAEVLGEADPESIALLEEPPEGQIVREMTADDEREVQRLQRLAPKQIATCKEYVDSLGLDMQTVAVERLFGGERIIVYYLAENRVDFRELVRQLAAQFQTRIEMRQIGVRDEAKLLADFGDCGKAVCCNTHLVQMPPVSMRMAKVQKATLDPAKISGRCGRLKCCLRYEFDTYEQMQKELPPFGARVMTPDGEAKVIGHEVLCGQLLVVTEDRRRLLVDVHKTQRLPRAKTPATSGDDSA